jgi:hypothetical protein
MPRFRLETALHVRERLEMLYQKALAEQVKVEQQYRDKKQLMEETLNHHHKDLDDAKTQGVTINQLLMGDRFQERIERQLELTQDQLNEQLDIVELKRHELTVATQKNVFWRFSKKKKSKSLEMKRNV